MALHTLKSQKTACGNQFCLSLYCVVSGDQTEAIRLDGKSFYLLNHLIGSDFYRPVSMDCI